MKHRKEYCVYTVPPGSLPARLVKCFRTKKAAQRYGRRERYLQIIPRSRAGLGSTRKREACYTYGPGREIFRKGEPFISIVREGKTPPVQADATTRVIVDLLNRRGCGLRKKRR